MSGTESINHVDLAQKMALLRELTAEQNKVTIDMKTWDKRERYIQLRKEISSLLMPLFDDLTFCNMLLMFDDDGPQQLKASANSGLMLSVREDQWWE